MAKVFLERWVVGQIVDVYPPRKVSVGGEKVAVVDFTIAITPSVKVDGEYEDGITEFVRCTAWRLLATNIAKTFRKGDRIVAHGEWKMQEAYTNKQGKEYPESGLLNVDFAGVDISYNPAKSTYKAANLTTALSERGAHAEEAEEEEEVTKAPAKRKAPARATTRKKAPAKVKEEELEEDIFSDSDEEEDIFSDSDDWDE